MSEQEKQRNALLSKLILKAITKAVKVSKTFLLLKWTKRVKHLKDEIEKGDKEEDKEKELEEVRNHLQAVKAMNHMEVGKCIAEQKFPHLYPEKSSSSSSLEDSLIQQILQSKQYQQAITGLEENLQKVVAKKVKVTGKANSNKKEKLRNSSSNTNTTVTSANKPAALVKVKTKANKKQILLGKAMFVDSLSSDEVVVPATETPEVEERRKESKVQKSLRNQRNRILNKMKREREIQEDMQKYLPVHLRNLPEPKKGKRGSEQPSSTTEESSWSSSFHDKPHYQDDRRGRKNMNNNNNSNNNKRPMSRDEGSYDRRDDRSNKRPRISSTPSYSSSTAPPASASAPAVVVDNKLVVTGKDWQASGIHPSWAAKQLKQSQLSIKIDATASQAKKIVFDDD
eukprot:scaffold299_cov162-Ochromonas_danica.AAC.1